MNGRIRRMNCPTLGNEARFFMAIPPHFIRQKKHVLVKTNSFLLKKVTKTASAVHQQGIVGFTSS